MDPNPLIIAVTDNKGNTWTADIHPNGCDYWYTQAHFSGIPYKVELTIGTKSKSDVLQELIDVAIGALADLANNDDLTRSGMQHKAKRIYDDIRSRMKE